jgi:response regulator RpfG family c-di-GMP phosphodiesterase
MKLKAATSAVPSLSPVQLCGHSVDALRVLSEGREWDTVFISAKLEPSQIAEFINQAKQTRGGRDSAYILVIGAQDQSSSAVAGHVLAGADSFLCEPYSVDSLQEISLLSSTIKQQRLRERQEGAVRLLVDDIIRTLDAVSLSLYLGQPPGHAIRDLKDLGSAIQNLNEEWRSVFYTELISRTEKLSAPVRPEVPKSRRVQEKLKKQREEVQKSQGTSVRIIRG